MFAAFYTFFLADALSIRGSWLEPDNVAMVLKAKTKLM
jgi:hypothetical protein